MWGLSTQLKKKNTQKQNRTKQKTKRKKKRERKRGKKVIKEKRKGKKDKRGGLLLSIGNIIDLKRFFNSQAKSVSNEIETVSPGRGETHMSPVSTYAK